MNSAYNTRLVTTKTILWLLVGVACAVITYRFVFGLGGATALTDLTPWGLWIGFDVMGKAKAMRAAFVSAGGYHHHVGLNTWQGEGAPPPPADALGLRYFTVVLPETAELERILARFMRAGIPTEQMDEGVLARDPSQNGVLFVVGGLSS